MAIAETGAQPGAAKVATIAPDGSALSQLTPAQFDAQQTLLSRILLGVQLLVDDPLDDPEQTSNILPPSRSIRGVASTWSVEPNQDGSLNVAGSAPTVSVSITRPADSNVYAANDNWADNTTTPSTGGFALPNVARVPGGAGTILDVIVTSSAVPATLLQGELWIFDSKVAGVGDNVAFVISDAEVLTLVAVIPFTLAGTGANNSFAHVQNLAIGYQCLPNSRDLRFLVKVKNAYTPVSGEVLGVRIKTIQTS